MKTLCIQFGLLLFLAGSNADGIVPDEYKGKPFQDATHTSGRLQAAFYDLGGEGIAYHDVDPINHGSGELNHKPEHCEEGLPVAVCRFREDEGVDPSYVKKMADLNHPNLVAPEWQQPYIGWTEDGEWTNYTVEVKKAGRYRIDAMYSHDFPHAGRQLLTLHYKQGNNLAYFDFMPEDKQSERASNPRLNHCQLTGDLQSTTIEWNRFQDRETYV